MDQILTTSRLFLRNLAFTCTEADLTALFSPFGSLLSVHLPLSQPDHKPLGTAFVRYAQGKDALAAYEGLDGRTFQGRLLHILPGRARPGEENVVTGPGAENEGRGKTSLKDARDGKKKGDAAKEFNWAMLYMNVSMSVWVVVRCVV